MTSLPRIHVSVLPREIVSWLDPQPGKVLVDGTLGAGGHTRLLAEKLLETGTKSASGKEGFVLAVDHDPDALAAAETNLAGLPVKIASSNFCDIPEILDELGIESVDGIVLDLGLSSDQLADGNRGFSFDAEGDLDLRFNPEEGEPAWQRLQRMNEEDIANVIYEYGEERFSRRIARKIVQARQSQPLRLAADYARIVRSCVPTSPKDKIDPATRTFQALRIFVNRELESLDIALKSLPGRLAVGGRLAIISFHSLEDRRVKNAFRDSTLLEVLTKKPITAAEDELAVNPRSRSAKLRVAQRMA